MKKLLFSILAIFMGVLVCATPVYADCVKTSVLGNSVCDKDNNKAPDGTKADGKDYFNCSCDEGYDEGYGEGIKDILNLVVDIMSVGVGILGVLGITIVGVQYLTAGGKEEQTRKAKRRLLEIVIGLAVYVLIAVLLKWLGVGRTS